MSPWPVYSQYLLVDGVCSIHCGMTDTDKQPAMTYPTPEQYEGWKADAEEMDMSVSEWMQAMVEAGRKKFDATVERDESAEQLRRQRNDLKDELEHARERIEELETTLHHGERETIRQFVKENPGATFGEIVQHVIDTVPERVNRHLDALEGDALHVDGDEYYPREGE
jgi:predicted RNase H-like nuclease (RuvC/YqgF family)